jgi:hypothetical protein
LADGFCSADPGAVAFWSGAGRHSSIKGKSAAPGQAGLGVGHGKTMPCWYIVLGGSRVHHWSDRQSARIARRSLGAKELDGPRDELSHHGFGA